MSPELIPWLIEKIVIALAVATLVIMLIALVLMIRILRKDQP